MTLNECDGSLSTLPPTDCRFRPDVRRLENGDIGETVLPTLYFFLSPLSLLPSSSSQLSSDDEFVISVSIFLNLLPGMLLL